MKLPIRTEPIIVESWWARSSGITLPKVNCRKAPLAIAMNSIGIHMSMYRVKKIHLFKEVRFFTLPNAPFTGGYGGKQSTRPEQGIGYTGYAAIPALIAPDIVDLKVLKNINK
ncbi:hypothetical protein [Desulfobacter latus]|uniref:Uncharacterized protein n=1 Tax=Desulfobacter latus TaxID=2292 RepID=A0A850T4Z6_9BACT|nr:hypothetical protein [Desulfobacter latus]NWH06843.1 hypothetical protein [Desulfobacter latus]